MARRELKISTNKGDNEFFNTEDAPEYFKEACSAIQNIADFFPVWLTNN